MKHRVYAIYDAAAGAYLPPFMLQRDQQAIRAFSDCCNSPSHQFGAHPGDYTLFFIGIWDDSSARYTQVAEGYTSLGNGVEHKSQQEIDLITEENG